jgi:hypothetical protein
MTETLPEHNINGWTFKIREDTKKPVPWVYENVKNCAYNFANEISIEKIILEVEENGKITERSLKFSDFETMTGEQPVGFVKHDLKTAQHSLSVSNFSVYEGNGLLLDCKTKKGVLPARIVEGEPVDQPLSLFFTILFGEYGNDPPHEFTGALQAARFTPAVEFETANDSVKSIRVHYRFHFNLNSYLKNASALTKLTAEARKKLWGIENYASVIRDADHFPPSVLATIKLLKDVFVMFADLKFLNTQLDACGFDGDYRSRTARLELRISEAGHPAGDRLNISFRDPRTSLTDAKALGKTSVSLTDKNVGALSVANSVEYNQTLVDELAAKVFEAIVGPVKPAQGLDTFPGQTQIVFAGTPLPGISAACLTSNIKFSLIQLIITNYRARKAATISTQLRSVEQQVKTDLGHILEYLEPGDFEQTFRAIAGLVRAILEEPLAPVVGQVMTLRKFAALAESMQKLAGKILSIAGFDAVEKPVLYELVGTYVNEGEVNDTWDNLHWWGTAEAPSAPGAFHAIHSHYRWTQLNTYPTAAEAELLDVANALVGTKQKLHYGAPQLRSLVRKFAANGLSGPLIDPKIPNQTISLALALNGGDLDNELMGSDQPFETAKATVNSIATTSKLGNRGRDIVYWLSCKAVRSGKGFFKGTLLVNGFYFAHDEEQPFSLFRPANLFAPTQGVTLQKPKRNAYPLFRRPSG